MTALPKTVPGKQQISEEGFLIIPEVYTRPEVSLLIDAIARLDTYSPTFRKSKDLFAVRQFLREAPETRDLIFNENLRELIARLFGAGYFVTKSIYFDKPPGSNWFVAYHQDLTISVDRRTNTEGFDSWTTKHGQFAVQPPLPILEGSFTIRIHLDDTDEQNGALKVIPGSHRKGVYRPENIDWKTESELSCPVTTGGIMIMKPLLLHASNRTTNDKPRRVIHIEFSNLNLPEGLNWSEKLAYC